MLMQREPVVRVLLGDADPLAGQAVTALLSAEANVAVIGCESGALGLTRAAEKCSPSVLVVDVGQQPFSGRGLLGQWVTLCPHIVALTTGLTPADAVELLRAGVRGLHPTTGRWTQKDSLNNPLDPANGNRYAYTGDDPVNFKDLSGKSFLSVVNGISAGIIGEGVNIACQVGTLTLVEEGCAGVGILSGVAVNEGLTAFDSAIGAS